MNMYESRKHLHTYVGSWFIFIPKIPIWEDFAGPWHGKWNIVVPFGIIYGRLV
jgi:hypothetical protein